jgi:CRISPR-associated protein Csx10
MRYYYIATALDGISINETHANAFSSTCLDYIPGSAIMGALAARLYQNDKISKEELDLLFQTNSVIFSNAYPLTDDMTMTLPAPMCLHYPKDTSTEKSNLENKCQESENDHCTQYKQVRSAFITPSLEEFHKVPCSTITRTAIDPNNQTAKDSTLHTQQFIEEGTSFLGFIDTADLKISDKVKELLPEFLSSKIRIGNSRNSEFGRVSLEYFEIKDLNLNKPQIDKDCLLYLWCISDCEFYNTETGSSSSVPVFSNIWALNDRNEGITGTYIPKHSFVRNISIRHFNRKRGGLESENLLVKKGSIICFKPSTNLSVKQMELIQKTGIGLNRHYGYGQVLVNPSWISQRKISDIQEFFAKQNIQKKTAVTKLSMETLNPNLMDWLDLSKETEGARNYGYKAVRFIVQLYKDLREYLGVMDTEYIGPSKTQWQKIMQVLTSHKSSGGGKNKISCCFEKLEETINEALPVKTNTQKEREWGIYFSQAGKFNSFAEHFKEHFKELQNDISIDNMVKEMELMTKYDLSSSRGIKELEYRLNKEKSHE